MVLSIHLTPASAPAAFARLRRRPRPADGLIWSITTITAPLGAGPAPAVDGNALVAAWRDDAALDAFLDADPLAADLAGGWDARLEPLRAYGELPELPGLGRPERPAEPGEPVVVLTLGRTKLHRLGPFLRASAPAERAAATHPDVLLSSALARPARFVGTFSLWRSAEAMRAYATGPGGPHARAMAANAQRPFHRRQLFARFRPTRTGGAWRGVADPLTAGVPVAA
ncbi:MAG TPA: hypothetical protein VNZ62_08915 [Capillimicrobium sp.]|nr:hypothetical protein [Capillimicrobium sp.]